MHESTDQLVREMLHFAKLFDPPNPPLKTDEALKYGWEVRRRVLELDRRLASGDMFPTRWVTRENQTKRTY